MLDLFSGWLLFVVIYFAFIIFFGTLAIAPTLIFGGLLFGSVKLGSFWHRSLAAISGIAILSIPLVAWQKHRQTYQTQVDTIVRRIDAAPKLGSMKQPPSVIFVRGHPFPEIDFGKTGCFPVLYTPLPDGVPAQWNPKGGTRSRLMPARYLEFDVDDRRKSKFGNRIRTGRRGPYELWLVDHDRRTLVDVFFIKGDGHTFIPPLILWEWAYMPTSLRNDKLIPALLDFIHLKTGQCGKELQKYRHS